MANPLPVTPPANLACAVQAARLLWGEEWVMPAARALRVNIRTIERLSRAHRLGEPLPLHPAWLTELAVVLGERMTTMAAMIGELHAQASRGGPVDATLPGRSPTP